MSEDELAGHLDEILGLHPEHPRAKPWLAEFDTKEARHRRRLRRGRVGETISNDLGMQFAWVPPGKSWLGGGGGTPGSKEFTLPKGLWCGVYPVTQAEWRAVMGNNPSHHKPFLGLFGQDTSRHPVEQVSWDDVQQFLAKLNGQNPRGGLVYRLPTEEEWEYTCRGGPLSKPQSSYHFYFARSRTDLTPAPTNDLSSHQANFNNTLQRTSEVGLYLPNPLGIHDLHGNVWEWTSSSEGSNRVYRGGSWSNQAVYCTASYRYGFGPGYRGNDLGFRLLAVPLGQE
jgi:formylglycine-generating enzyme required for sulfatase activity